MIPGVLFFLEDNPLTEKWMIFSLCFSRTSYLVRKLQEMNWTRRSHMAYLYFSVNTCTMCQQSRWQSRMSKMSLHRNGFNTYIFQQEKCKWYNLQQVSRTGSDPIESTMFSSCLQTFYIAMQLSINLWNWKVMDLAREQACLSCEIDFSSGSVVFGVHKVKLPFYVFDDIKSWTFASLTIYSQVWNYFGTIQTVYETLISYYYIPFSKFSLSSSKVYLKTLQLLYLKD